MPVCKADDECKAYILDLIYVQAKEVQKYPHFYGIKQP